MQSQRTRVGICSNIILSVGGSSRVYFNVKIGIFVKTVIIPYLVEQRDN